VLGAVAIDRTVLAATASGVGCLAIACGGVITLRRLTVGVTLVPDAGPLAALCIGGGLLVAVGDVAAGLAGKPRPMLARIGFFIAAVATALPLPVGRPGTAAMAVASVACAAALLVRPGISRRRRRVTVPAAPAPVDPPAEGPAIRPPPVAAPWSTSATAAAPGEHLLQRQERVALADGGECVRGRLYLAVAAGSRNASGHVGFCPPLATTPTVELSTAYDDVEAVVVAAEVLPWGVRVECRLDEPADEPLQIPIDVLAVTPSCPLSPPHAAPRS
jgi:hypothetical protein